MNTETLDPTDPKTPSNRLNSVAVRLTAAHRLVTVAIMDDDMVEHVLEAIHAIIEVAMREIDLCEKSLGGPGTGTLD